MTYWRQIIYLLNQDYKTFWKNKSMYPYFIIWMINMITKLKNPHFWTTRVRSKLYFWILLQIFRMHLLNWWFNRFSEPTESRSTSPQIYSAPVSSQSQTNPLASLSTPAVSLGLLQSQVSSTPYGFQPQITSFLHQFEQFANKSVRI